jgi:predicted O-methyltransferase YrrM
MIAEQHLAAGRAAEAIAACEEVLALEPDCLPAHICMARAKLPGEDFLAYLAHFHEMLRPRIYLEIGVDVGRTLSLARPPTRVLGVDPAAKAERDLAAATRLFRLESDVFFESGEAERALEGENVDLAFVDGLHHFEQALRDFLHIEQHARPRSVVLFHDCLPLTAATASRRRATGFWTGDVWKIAPILRRWRPDLDAFLIPCYPTGLLAVTRLDPRSPVLAERLEEVVAEWTPKEWSGGPLDPALPVVPNDWAAVRARIRPPGG